MVQVPIKIVGLGNYDRSDQASAVIIESRKMGAQADFIIDEGEAGDFDQGLIDWRGALDSTHWLLLSSSGSLGDGSMKSAWGSSMTFAELEGCKTVMIVESPSDSERLEEAWGNVIERIRQIQILYLSLNVIEGLAKIEGREVGGFIEEVRKRSLVPIVCTINQKNGLAILSHSQGEENVEISSEISAEYWLANFLCMLPKFGQGPSGIVMAAGAEKIESDKLGNSD
ncbi:MAG: hypothetical protein CMB61_04125 [Euryarchaeota archaeon]|nr:hypothetical protein [Euryarchaeota archaeon]